MNFDVITIGSAVRDTYLFIDKKDAVIIDNPKNEITRKKLIGLEYGAKIDVEESFQTVGGGGMNSAVTFSRFGLKSAASVSVGEDDNAGVVYKVCKDERINTKFVQNTSKKKTGFSTLIVAGKKKDRIAIADRGANNDQEFNTNKSGINNTKWYYTTSLSGNHWEKVLKNITSLVKKNNTKWAWNPGGAQLDSGLKLLGKYLKHCTVFILNRDEAIGLLAHRSGKVKDNPKDLLLSILKFGSNSVIITDGPKGVYYADQSKMIHVSADLSVVPKEKTGAGDSFGSGFIAGLILNKDIGTALGLAVSNSESVIQDIGAQKGILYKQDIKKIKKDTKHKITEIN
jgi:sugar/nucleoside kinase (ribokinase family)